MKPDKTLVIDVGHLHDNAVHCNKATNLGRYPGAIVSKGWVPDRSILSDFLSGLDVVFSAECFYNNELPRLARRMGIKTVLAPNYEFLDRSAPPDLWAPPTLWHWGDIPQQKVHLPVPIETDKLSPRLLPEQATHFLHVCGRPAHLDRNGTRDLLLALPHITAQVTVTVRCQQPGYVSGLVPDLRTPKNVTFIVDSGSVDDHWDLYSQGDALVSPRRYGGLHLPALEALGAGMPVIMPNISPNNAWLPQEWLVEANFNGNFMAKQRIDYYSADPLALARKIDQFSTDPAFYLSAKEKAAKLAGELSWANMKPVYEKVLGG